MQVDRKPLPDSEFLRRGLSEKFLEIFFDYFKYQHGISKEGSNSFLDGCLLFLHLSENFHRTQPHLGIYLTPALAWLDAYWDRFVLHTRQYSEYCQLHFGKMMHHEPATFQPDVSTSRRLVDEYRQYLIALEAEFGPELIQSWFIDFRKQWEAFEAIKRGSNGANN